MELDVRDIRTYTINASLILLPYTLDENSKSHVRILPSYYLQRTNWRHFYTTVARYIIWVDSICACIRGREYKVWFSSKDACPDFVHNSPQCLRPSTVMVHENITRPLPSTDFPALLRSRPFNCNWALYTTYVSVHEPVVRGPLHVHGWTYTHNIRYRQKELKKNFWEELFAYCPLIRHGPQRQRRLQQFFFCCVCTRCCGNVFTEPLPSNDRWILIQTQRLMGGFYEERRWDGLRCRDMHTKFLKYWFSHSNVSKGDM
jgi:hypothetical protein